MPNQNTDKEVLNPFYDSAYKDQYKTSAAYCKIVNIARSRDSLEAFIDWEEFARAAQRFLPLKDIAYQIGVSRETLNRACKKHFKMTSRQVWEAYAAPGKRVITSRIFQKGAEEGNLKALLHMDNKHISPVDRYTNITNRENLPDIEVGDYHEIDSEENNTGPLKYAPKIIGFEGTKEDLGKLMKEFIDFKVFEAEKTPEGEAQ